MSENRVKRKKLTLTLKIKNEIINRIDGGESYSQLSREFGVGRSTIYDIYKNRNNIEETAAKLPYKSQRKTLRAAENPELEEKLYQWYLEERNLYPMTGSLIILKARTLHKEMTGNDDFMASTGWLDRFKKRRGIVLGSIVKACASSSKPDTPPPQRETLPVPNPAQTANDANTDNKGEQLVMRTTDNRGSKRNVFNRFTTSDGHFENVIVKEEMLENYNQEDEEDHEMAETEVEVEPDESGEMFPQPETILGTTDEMMEEKNSAISDLNDTLRKFLAEYKTRNALMRERIDLERARLQFDMEVYRSRQMEKRVIAVNAANANVMKSNALSVANSGSGNTITVGSTGHVGNAANIITVNASTGNAVTTSSGVKPNPVITLNPISSGSSGNGIAVTIESVRNANVANTANSAYAVNTANVINVAKTITKNAANAAVDIKNETQETDET